MELCNGGQIFQRISQLLASDVYFKHVNGSPNEESYVLYLSFMGMIFFFFFSGLIFLQFPLVCIS